MYDGGNQIQVQFTDTAGVSTLSSLLEYNDDCDGLHPTTVPESDIVYSTCKNTRGEAVFWSAKFFSRNSRITGFKVSGDLGADGHGTVQAEDLGVDDQTGLFRGFWKSVSDGAGTGDPPINHLILVPDAGHWSHTVPDNTLLDDDMVTAAIPSQEVIYLMWAGDRTREHAPVAAVHELMNFVIRSCSS